LHCEYDDSVHEERKHLYGIFLWKLYDAFVMWDFCFVLCCAVDS
jgi:hypothetical protein